MSVRQGRKRLIDAFEEISKKRQRVVSKSEGPLSDVIACLTGLKTEQKAQFHKMIEALGGRYVHFEGILFEQVTSKLEVGLNSFILRLL